MRFEGNSIARLLLLSAALVVLPSSCSATAAAAKPMARATAAADTTAIANSASVSTDTDSNGGLDIDRATSRQLGSSTVCPTCVNLARSCGIGRDEPCPTSQTSTLEQTNGRTWESGRGNDGDSTTAFQTYGNGYQEWTVTLDRASVIEDIVVTNYDSSPFMERLDGAQLDVLDGDGNVVASRTLTGDAGEQAYVFAEIDEPVGRTVRISKTVEGFQNLHAYEVEVYGPAPLPTPASTVNLARSCGADLAESCPTSQTTTASPSANGRTWESAHGNDGIKSEDGTFQTSGDGYRQWTVDFQHDHNLVDAIVLTNLDSPWGDSLNNAKVDVLDGAGTIVATRVLTGAPGEQTYVFDERPVGKSVRVRKTVVNNQHLRLMEVEVYGFAIYEKPIDGYQSTSNGGCAGRNELGSTFGGSMQDCADACGAEPTCVSFEYSKTGTECMRSTTCTSLDMTLDDPNDPFYFYLKLPQVDGYGSALSTGGCSGRNELGSTTGGTVQDCAEACDAEPTCVSFEYTKEGTTCQRSTTCNSLDMTLNDSADPFLFYLRLGPDGTPYVYDPPTSDADGTTAGDGTASTGDASSAGSTTEGTASTDDASSTGSTTEGTASTGDASSTGTTTEGTASTGDASSTGTTTEGTASTGDASTTGSTNDGSTSNGDASTGDASTTGSTGDASTGDALTTTSTTEEAAEAVKTFAEATAAYKEAEHNLEAMTTMCADLTETHEHHLAESQRSTTMYQQAVTYEAMMKEAYDLAMTKDSTPAERFRLRIEAEEAHKESVEAMEDAKAAMDAAVIAEVTAKTKCDMCCHDADTNCPSGGEDCVGMAAMKEAQTKPIYEAAKRAVETNPLIPQDINPATKDFVYQDVDGDLIPDSFDACPTLAGLRRNTAKRTSADKPGPQDFCPSGCPEVDQNNEVVDSDGDGINDCEDRCPFKPGIRYNHNWSYGVDLATLPRELDYNGCPDKDNDGIPDVFDACPTRAGGKCYSGCPDKGIDASTNLPFDLDMDGVSDCDDRCPGHYNPDGPNGCADADNDGTPDYRDYCFMSPGWASFSFDRKLEDEPSTTTAGYWVPGKTKHLNILGCPDRDGDLVPDQADFCIFGNQDAANYPGLKFVPVVGRNGCPLDSDQDGVHDGIDQCDNTVHSPKPEHGRAHRVYKPEADDYIPDTGDYRLGCPKDSDGDGFPDGTDQCPDQGGYVDRVGCPVDTDGDGVGDCSSDELLDIITWPLTTTACHSRDAAPDESCCNVVKDMCPNTPRGAKAYPTVFAHPTLGDIEPGCPFDSDLDGVFDGIDKCPKTTQVELTKATNEPHKLKIDQVGCALLAARVWESTFVGLTPDTRRRLQAGDGSDLELVFSVDESLPQVLTTNGYDVQQDMVAPEVKDATCQMSINDETKDDELIPTTSSVNDMGDYTGLMPNEQVPVKVDLSLSGGNIVGSDVWSSEPPYDSGSASFCVSVPVLDDTGGHVTEKQMKTNLDYDMSQGLGMLGEGDVTIEEYETIITTTKVIDISYPINACQCTKNNVCVEDSDLDDSFLSQSSSLRVCVRFAPDEEKQGALPPNYVKMMNIKNFQCTQNGVTFAAISNFKRQGDGGQLTSVKVIDDEPEEGSYYGEDDRMITVDSRLPATFFGKEERPVTCVGTIVYEYADGEIIDPNGNVVGRRRMLAEAFIAPSGRTNSQPGSIEITEPQGKFTVDVMLAKIGASASGLGAIVGSVVASVAVVASVGVIGVKYGSAITGSFSGKPTTPANFQDVTGDTEASWSTASNQGPSPSDFNVRVGMVA